MKRYCISFLECWCNDVPHINILRERECLILRQQFENEGTSINVLGSRTTSRLTGVSPLASPVMADDKEQSDETKLLRLELYWPRKRLNLKRRRQIGRQRDKQTERKREPTRKRNEA